MKANASGEQRFIAAVDAFEFITHDVTVIVRAMEDWLTRLNGQLASNRLTWKGLNSQSALARKANAVDHVIDRCMTTWTEQWRSDEPAHIFANSFDDKLLLLVFGKFNAGKSSFCNLLADRFAARGKALGYFYLQDGEMVETPERFAEGATETTLRLQGVRLADKLVLVDTPGLHSITPENAALTQRFADSADGVLWLTSSTSPGQVQELNELGRELHRNKPLLPVVTRSDVYEEDEVDGAICKVLRAKTPENRAEQEADVRLRASEKLAEMGVCIDTLKPPVSISTHLAREMGGTHEAMNEAGFERLFNALLDISETTLAYKRRKQAEVLLHHLEENVIAALDGELAALLRALRRMSDDAKDALEAQQSQLANALWRAVAPELPRLLDERRDIAAQLSALTRAALVEAVGNHLHDYHIDVDMLDTPFEIDDRADYQLLREALAKAIHRIAHDTVDRCNAALQHFDASMDVLETSLYVHEVELSEIKRMLRNE
jgi:GTPase SAR1 family protein